MAAKPKKKNLFCCYCEKRLNRSTVTREHIIPKSKGGTITIPCCLRDNALRGNLGLEQFIAEVLILDVGVCERLRMVKNIRKFMKLYPEAC